MSRSRLLPRFPPFRRRNSAVRGAAMAPAVNLRPHTPALTSRHLMIHPMMTTTTARCRVTARAASGLQRTDPPHRSTPSRLPFYTATSQVALLLERLTLYQRASRSVSRPMRSAPSQILPLPSQLQGHQTPQSPAPPSHRPAHPHTTSQTRSIGTARVSAPIACWRTPLRGTLRRPHIAPRVPLGMSTR